MVLVDWYMITIFFIDLSLDFCFFLSILYATMGEDSTSIGCTPCKSTNSILFYLLPPCIMKLLDAYRTDEPLVCMHCGTPIINCVDVIDETGIQKTIGSQCFKNLYLNNVRPETKARFNRLINRLKQEKYNKYKDYEMRNINESLNK